MKRIITTLLAGTLAIGCGSQASQTSGGSESKAAENTSTIANDKGGAKETAQPQEKKANAVDHTYFFDKYCEPYKVEGEPGIRSFVNAINLEEEWGQFHDSDFDEANGYFMVAADGEGSCQYYGAFWNRTDGKKMFILSFDICNADEEGIAEYDRTTDWYKMRSEHGEFDGEEYWTYEESGIVAYLYNSDTKMLEPMERCPFNNMPQSSDVPRYELPQSGKDIKVFNFDENEHTLKFNGLTFDWVK